MYVCLVCYTEPDVGDGGFKSIVVVLPVFLACEIPAFCLGLLSRKTGLGKAAMIVSVTLMLVSLLLLA